MTIRNRDTPFPPIPKALMDELNFRFPEKTPSMTDTDREIWASVGRRSVIQFLNKEFERQNKIVPVEGDAED
jgi:hypothetical protein